MFLKILSQFLPTWSNHLWLIFLIFVKDETNWYHCENTDTGTKKLLDYLSIKGEREIKNLRIDEELGTCVSPSPQVNIIYFNL